MFFGPSLLILVTAFFCCNARIQKITSVDPNSKSSISTKRQADDTSLVLEQNLSLTSLNDKSSVIETENNGFSQKSENSEGSFPPNILSEISMPLPLSPSTSIPNESQNLNGNSNFFETLADSLKSLDEHPKISPPVVVFSKTEKLGNPVPENKMLFPDKFSMTIQNQDNLNKKNYADNSQYHQEPSSSFQGGLNNDMKNPWNNVQVDPTNQNNNLESNPNQISLANPQIIITTTNKPIQSVVLLNLPKKTIYAEPGIDTPISPSSINSKRQISKLAGLRAPKIGLLRKTTTTIAPTTSDSSEIHQASADSSSDPESSVQISLDSASNLVPANANLAESSNLVPSVPSSLSKSKPAGGTIIALPIPSSDMTQQSEATQSNEPVPCTCGVFLSGQFKRGSNAQPTGNSIITHEFDAPFACTTSGKNLCTNKCLDVLVKHLPNSGPIICGTVEDDIVREKAYLFVKNCRDIWVNTNLSSGKEHCCKNGEPIKCSTLPS